MHIFESLYRGESNSLRRRPWDKFRRELHKKLRKEIKHADDSAKKHLRLDSNFNWYREFWEKLSDQFEVCLISLNYDTLFEDVPSVLAGSLRTGFVRTPIDIEHGTPIAGLREFAPEEFSRPGHHILRPHGSIKFRNYSELGIMPDRFGVENLYYEAGHLYSLEEDLVLSDASPHHAPAAENPSPYRNDLPIAAIVAGRKKEDTATIEPYKTYYRWMESNRTIAPVILVIGFGFRDSHITDRLQRALALHRQAHQSVKVWIVDKSRVVADQAAKALQLQPAEIHVEYSGFAQFARDAHKLNEMISYFQASGGK